MKESSIVSYGRNKLKQTGAWPKQDAITSCKMAVPKNNRLPHNGRSFFEVKEQVKGKEITGKLIMRDNHYQKSDSSLEQSQRTVNS